MDGLLARPEAQVYPWDWPFLWQRIVPSQVYQLYVDIYARSTTNPSGDVPTWMDLDGYTVLCSQYGTDYSVTYTLAAGAQAGVGDDDANIQGGLQFGVSWSTTSTPVTQKWKNNNHWTTSSKYYHLGQIFVDAGEDQGDNTVDWHIIAEIGLPNSQARQREGDQFTFFVRVKVIWDMWRTWPIACNLGYNCEQIIEFAWIGNNSPSADAKLTLMPCSNINP